MWFHDAHGYSHAGGLCLAPGADPWLVDLGLLDWYTFCNVCPCVCTCIFWATGMWILGYWIGAHPECLSVCVCVFRTMCASPCNASGQSLMGSFCFH